MVAIKRSAHFSKGDEVELVSLNVRFDIATLYEDVEFVANLEE